MEKAYTFAVLHPDQEKALQSFPTKRFLQAAVILASVLAMIPFGAGASPAQVKVDNSGFKATGSTITINVSIRHAAAFNFFNIYVSADSSVLAPVSISLGSGVSSWFELANCENGVGSGCDINDGSGVAHETAVSSTGASVSGTTVLFSITYVVAGPGGSAITMDPVNSQLLLGSNSISVHIINGAYNVP